MEGDEGCARGWLSVLEDGARRQYVNSEKEVRYNISSSDVRFVVALFPVFFYLMILSTE